MSSVLSLKGLRQNSVDMRAKDGLPKEKIKKGREKKNI